MAACPKCNGSGEMSGEYPPCGNCNGRGFIGSDTQNRCTACAGSGHLPSREQVPCSYCAGTGRDPFAAREKSATVNHAKRAKSSRRQAAGTKEDDIWQWASVAAAAITAGWSLYFLLNWNSYGPDQKWVPFVVGGVAALAGARFWRIAAKAGIFLIILFFAWAKLQADGGLEEPWMPFVFATGAATLSLYAWRLAAVGMLGITGYALIVVTQEGISPAEVTNGIRDMIDIALRATVYAPK